METGHSGDLAHRQALEILPWYVNGRLEPEESNRVKAHLGDCDICRREADGLASMLATEAASIPERPVNEERLKSLFARIDRYETERQERPGREGAARVSSWQQLRELVMSWLTMRPALVAGAFAAVLLAAVVVPVLRAPSPTTAPYEALGPAADALRVRINFQTAPSQSALDSLVAAARSEGKLAGPYRVERLTNTQYVVVFEEKPGIDAVSRIIHTWRGAPNVAEVKIDDSTEAPSR